MTATGGRGTTVPSPPVRLAQKVARVTGAVGPLGIGVATLWLSIIVLLPLAALTVTSFDDGIGGFWDAITAPVALGVAARDRRWCRWSWQ